MCGRSRCTLTRQQVIAAAKVRQEKWRDAESFQPSQNVSPGFKTPIVKREKDSNDLEVHTMKWGLVPSFTKAGERPDHYRMFNARCETVTEKPVFKRLLNRQKCIVLLDGFYEWAQEGKAKQPYYIHLEGDEVMRMAGLFDVWHNGEDVMYSYTILTTDSSPRLTWLHNRMPVVLRTDEAVENWLEPSLASPDMDLKALHSLFRPYNGEDLVWHPVTRAMSKPGYQEPDCAKPFKKPNIATFFSKRGPAKQAAEAPLLASDSSKQPTVKTDDMEGVEQTNGGTESMKPQEGRAMKDSEIEATRADASAAEPARPTGSSERKEEQQASEGATEAKSPASAATKRKQPPNQQSPASKKTKAAPASGKGDIRSFFSAKPAGTDSKVLNPQ